MTIVVFVDVVDVVVVKSKSLIVF